MSDGKPSLNDHLSAMANKDTNYGVPNLVPTIVNMDKMGTI